MLTLHQKAAEPRMTQDRASTSPPSSPAHCTIERRILHPQILSDLRHACARIVLEAGPSGPEYDDIVSQQDPLERYHNERSANRDYRSHNYNPDRSVSRNRKCSDPDLHPAAYVHKPSNAARDFQNTASARSRGYSQTQEPSFEPLEPTHTTVSGSKLYRKPVLNDPLAQIRASLDSRPKTSAAACIDYNNPSPYTSSSTSRTATTYDPARTSTGITSQALTPAKGSSKRVSEQVLQDGAAASLADATAKAWMAQELARRRAAESKCSAVPSRGQSIRNGLSSSDPDRPQSRAGSIRSGIQNYIRPRASSDSMRSTRTDNSSRSASRDGSSTKATHGSWWRGASAGLRRKGSWSSFRSARTDNGEDAAAEAKAGKGGEVNLNRSLPPLPGLDQYVEKKEPKLHISQLMARRTPVSKPTGNGLARSMSAREEAQRQEELQKLVVEKMLHGAMSRPTSTGTQSVEPIGNAGPSANNSREREREESAIHIRHISGDKIARIGEERERKEMVVNAVQVPQRKEEFLNPRQEMPSPGTERKRGFMARWSRLMGSGKGVLAN